MEKSKIENVQSKPGPFPSVAQPCGPSPGPLGLLACKIDRSLSPSPQLWHSPTPTLGSGGGAIRRSSRRAAARFAESRWSASSVQRPVSSS